MYQPISIHNIPSAVWGPSSEKVILAVHGNLSSKTDTPIRLLAETAVQKGYQVLSFDLPEHGDRKKRAHLMQSSELRFRVEANHRICSEKLERHLPVCKQHRSLFQSGCFF